MPAKPERDRMTVAEVARAFSTSTRNVKAMTDRKEIPYLRVADGWYRGEPVKRYVYSRAQIDAYKRELARLSAEETFDARRTA